MQVKVELWAFGKGEVREVEIPANAVTDDVDALLTLVFKYGQNEFQPLQFPSVSVGDIINFKTYGGQPRRFAVKGIGFEEINDDVYQNYVKLPQSERCFKFM